MKRKFLLFKLQDYFRFNVWWGAPPVSLNSGIPNFTKPN